MTVRASSAAREALSSSSATRWFPPSTDHRLGSAPAIDTAPTEKWVECECLAIVVGKCDALQTNYTKNLHSYSVLHILFNEGICTYSLTEFNGFVS